MNYKDFIKDFIQLDNMEFVNKHKKTDYIPYTKKVEICKKIIEVTSYVEINGNREFKINTPVQYMFFVLNVLDLYTDINIDWNDVSNTFDELNRDSVIAKVIDIVVSENEYNEFQVVLNMVKDDVINYETNIVSYINRKINSLDIFSEQLKEILEENISV